MKKILIIIAIIVGAIISMVFLFNIVQERKAIEQIQRTYAPTKEQINEMVNEIKTAEYKEEARLLDSIRKAEAK